MADDASESGDKFDNVEGWVDEVDQLTEDERKDLQHAIRPVKLALVKIKCMRTQIKLECTQADLCPLQLRRLAFKIVRSTTNLLLPAWRRILEERKEPITVLLRDVATRWNSTFDMLDYSLNHREVVDTMTQRRELGLCAFE